MAHKNTYKRKEIKYCLTEQQYRMIMFELGPFIQADKYGKSTVCNLYCDTSDWELARRSIDKPVYKEKLRLRGYDVNSPDDRVFLELKKKWKGIVYKRRFACTLRDAMAYLRSGIEPPGANQVFREIDYTIHHYNLQPKLFLAYDRLAYCGREDEEFRLTFDFNIRSRTESLSFMDGMDTELLTGQPFALMEVKAAQAMPRWFVDILNQNQLYPASFSKYGQVYQKLILAKKEREKCLKVS